MPVHISEIGVRLVVGPTPAPDQRPEPLRPPSGDSAPTGSIPPDKLEELVAESTQRVLQTLRRLEER